MDNNLNFTNTQTFPLSKDIKKIKVGLGWDMIKQDENLEERFLKGDVVDLDLSCLQINQHKKIADTVSYRQLISGDGCIKHSGDNETGAGDGDDESITVDLYNLPSDINTLFFTVTAFSGQSFEYIDNAFCRLVDESHNQEIANYTLSTDGSHTAVIVMKLSRHGNEWTAEYLGETSHGRSIDALLPQIVTYL
jgi:tellurium resistance protein TerZ